MIGATIRPEPVFVHVVLTRPSMPSSTYARGQVFRECSGPRLTSSSFGLSL